MGSENNAPGKRRRVKELPGGEEEGGYIAFRKIDVSLLEEGPFSFELYLLDGERDELISLLDRGSSFSPGMRKELLEKGVEVLYVHPRDGKALDGYVEPRIHRMVKSNAPVDLKLELIYNCALAAVEETSGDRNEDRNIERMKRIVSAIVDLFAAEEDAARSLMKLTIKKH